MVDVSAVRRRVRPTVSQVRVLERALESQLDGTSVLVADCDGWRAKYRSLVRKYDVLIDELVLCASDKKFYMNLSHDYKVMVCDAGKASAIEAENLKERVKELEAENNELADEVARLRGKARGGVLSRMLGRIGL